MFLSDEYNMDLEVTYLRLRYHKPKLVYKISPIHGFSTTAILLALQKNNRGTLHRFDLHKNSLDCVPDNLREA